MEHELLILPERLRSPRFLLLVFCEVRYAQSLIFCVLFCRSPVCHLSFILRRIYFLFFFLSLRLLITYFEIFKLFLYEGLYHTSRKYLQCTRDITGYCVFHLTWMMALIYFYTSLPVKHEENPDFARTIWNLLRAFVAFYRIHDVNNMWEKILQKLLKHLPMVDLK